MADKQNRDNVRGRNDVQGMVLSGVSRQSESFVADEDSLRVLDTRAMLFHYNHTKARPPEYVGSGKERRLRAIPDTRCGFCRDGVEGVTIITQNPPSVVGDGVAEDTGIDGVGPTTPARDSWWNRAMADQEGAL